MLLLTHCRVTCCRCRSYEDCCGTRCCVRALSIQRLWYFWWVTVWVVFTMCAQLWKRAKTKQTNNTIINLCTFLPFCFAGVATLKSFTLWLHWMCSICGLSFLSVVTSGAHIRHRADWITGKTRGCNLFLASYCVLCFYWAQWVELHTGFVSFTDYRRLCSYLIIKQNSAGTHHC